MCKILSTKFYFLLEKKFSGAGIPENFEGILTILGRFSEYFGGYSNTLCEDYNKNLEKIFSWWIKFKKFCTNFEDCVQYFEEILRIFRRVLGEIL